MQTIDDVFFAFFKHHKNAEKEKVPPKAEEYVRNKFCIKNKKEFTNLFIYNMSGTICLKLEKNILLENCES